MRLLVQFPTLARPEKFLRVLDSYVSKISSWNQIFFNINCDVDDETMNDAYIRERIKYILSKRNEADGVVNYDSNTDKISAINAHIDEQSFDIVICASDDMVPKAYSWDQRIVEAMQDHFPSLDGCVHFNDGNTNGDLITFSILGRKLYEYFGYIYHPDYKSLYCDDEFTQVVKAMGKEKYIDNVIITHEHYSVEGTENHGDVDFAARKTLHYSGRDQLVFNKRKEMGFPKHRITAD
tara:strand:- start:762 stop:1472 length:711 start_codon:yes stop_codon:yes gene_type:complete